MAKEKIVVAIMFVTALLGTVTASAQKNQNIISHEQVFGLRENYTLNQGLTSTLFYKNFEVKGDESFSYGVCWGTEFSFAFATTAQSGKFLLKPVSANAQLGAHLGFGALRLYTAARFGVSTVEVNIASHNEMFTRTTHKRHLTLAPGLEFGLQCRLGRLVLGAMVSYDYNIFKMPSPSSDGLTIDAVDKVANPFSMGVSASVLLGDLVSRRCGDFTWIIEAGAGLYDDPYGFVKMAQNFRHGKYFNGEVGAQIETNYWKDLSAFLLTYEESYYYFGSNTWVCPLIGTKIGITNNPVETIASATEIQEGGEGEIYSHNKCLQPGFMAGGYAGVKLRLFGNFEMKLYYDLAYSWTSKPEVNGYDESDVNVISKCSKGFRVGLTYSLD